MGSHNSPRLVAAIQKSGRQQFRVLLRDFTDGSVKAEIRIYERHGDADWEPSARHVVVGRPYLRELVDGLLQADALLKAEAA
ncbi:hypothetical protein AB7M49_008155 [Bradyrhizobium elkanii]